MESQKVLEDMETRYVLEDMESQLHLMKRNKIKMRRVVDRGIEPLCQD